MPDNAKEAKEIDAQLAQAQRQIEVLRRALGRVLKKLDTSSSMNDASRGATSEEPPIQISVFPHPALPWRLVSMGRVLMTPNEERISLSEAEYQLIHQIFSSPDLRVTFAEVGTLVAHRSTGAQRLELSSAVKMRLSRLRKKIREYGIELPLYSVRGTGLQFLGSAEISERRL